MKWVHYRLSPHMPSWVTQAIEQAWLSQQDDVQAIARKLASTNCSGSDKAVCIQEICLNIYVFFDCDVFRMKTLTVFDPAMCHSTGVCGSDVDQVLVAFSVDVYWLKGRGLQVERYNLAQQPMSFVHDEKAKAFLKASGADGLSLQLLDGETVMGGRYPKCAELARWFGIPLVRYPAGEGKVHGFACVLQTLNPPLVPALARPVPAVHLH